MTGKSGSGNSLPSVSHFRPLLSQTLNRRAVPVPSCVAQCVNVTWPNPELHRTRPKYVIEYDGSPLTIENLPAPGMKRWVIRRKAEVVTAVRGGLLTLRGSLRSLQTYGG